jgi:hypothetical protein
MDVFRRFWLGIVPARKLRIIDRLVDLAEDNIELSFDDIFRFCLDDRDDVVRARAVDGLWESEDPALIRPFVRLLMNDPSPSVQASAALALGKFALLGRSSACFMTGRGRSKCAGGPLKRSPHSAPRRSAKPSGKPTEATSRY